MSDKYVVFRRDQFLFDIDTPGLVDDAVVIRRQDMFAPAVLTLYSQNVVTVMNMLHSMGVAREDLKQLEEIADYFSEQAEMSFDTQRKVPD